MLEYITLPEGTLPPVAPYAHAVRAGDFLYITGQLAEDPATGEIKRGPIPEQVKQVMDNLKLVLDHTQAGFDKVVMARVFITDFRDYPVVNEIYASYFPAGRLPCRTTVGVIGLAGLGDVEIDLVVYCGG
ncbi:RidA family protein [Leptolyngbya sp. FACHB-261]|uniref:RidA family protein n=1 Tax=Leptolyngbya sp. FACHB-261 TaxID=2692806 RepID=UPI0016861766|nr:RidA family protein [Leptolyngbya sp. FACHB-261]MBD2100799.1 RidA family protein [Leptolyngbya sp. FACHB-261]